MNRRLVLWGPRYAAGTWDGELEDVFRLLGWEVYRSPRFHEEPEREAEATLGLIQELGAAVFLTSHVAWTGGPNVATLRRYQEAGALTVTWSHDEPYRWDGYDDTAARQAPGYRLWFTNWDDAAHLAGHTAGRVVVAPCASRKAFRPRQGPQEAQDVEIGFLGVYYPPRDPYLRAVKDLGLKAWMKPRTEKPFHRWPPPPDIRVCLADRANDLSPEQVAAVCRRSKISLDIAEQPDGRVRCPKNRMFESTACGSLTLAGRCAQTEALFRDGEHLVLYDGPDDLREKAEYYLAHPEEAAMIARDGSRWTLAQHTWLQRCVQMSREIDIELSGRTPRLGVVIPTCNRAELFRRAYLSVQGLPIVVVQTGQQEIAPGDYTLVEARGATAGLARNLGVAALPASVRWVRFLDDDDVAAAGWEEAIRPGLHGGADAIVGAARSGDPRTADLVSPATPYTSQVIVNRAAFQEVGGFLANVTLAEERELLSRLGERWETDAVIAMKGGEDLRPYRRMGGGTPPDRHENPRWRRF